MYSLASKSTYYSPEKVVTFLVDISQYTVDKTYKKEITFKLIKFTDVSKIQRNWECGFSPYTETAILTCYLAAMAYCTYWQEYGVNFIISLGVLYQVCS